MRRFAFAHAPQRGPGSLMRGETAAAAAADVDVPGDAEERIAIASWGGAMCRQAQSPSRRTPCHEGEGQGEADEDSLGGAAGAVLVVFWSNINSYDTFRLTMASGSIWGCLSACL